MKSDKYRNEYKYLVNYSQKMYLENQAKLILKEDNHTTNGVYNIRSLYFDDYYNSCYYDNENGADPREKFRIRIYNHSKERISLECKRKERGKTLKTSCIISEELCLDLMNNRIIGNYDSQGPLINKLVYKMLNYGLRPKTIIEYDRKPFVFKDGNVRITFDDNISSSNYVNMFFEKSIPKRSILPFGINLLEVKFDEFLPDVIYNTMQLDSLQQTAFSKYYLGRCYELGRKV